MILLLLLAGCSSIEGLKLPFELPSLPFVETLQGPAASKTGTPGADPGTPPAGVSPETAVASAATPGAETPGTDGTLAAGTPSLQPEDRGSASKDLILWVPPEFDPSSGTTAGNLLADRLKEFSRQNDGIKVQVRVKAPSGPGGLLESLAASSAAAPLTLPSVVALSRADLEVAALKGLIFPLDGISTVIDQNDWYDYARQLSLVQGAAFALPFAGDVQVLAYRPGGLLVQPTDWPAVFRLGQPLAFAAGDPQAMMVLSLYRSLGGTIEDAQRRPTLQPEVLSQVLQLLADGEQRGVFPYWFSQYETSGQVWQAFRDGRVNSSVTWASYYLSTLPSDTLALPLPSIDDTPQALATGWGWSVADPDPDHRALSVRLAEFLSDGKFLSEWTEAAGYLPTRPSALAAWSNQTHKTLLSPVAVSAQARPTVDQLSSLGPVLKEATLKVLKRESDPTQAAQAAAEKLAVPETR